MSSTRDARSVPISVMKTPEKCAERTSIPFAVVMLKSSWRASRACGSRDVPLRIHDTAAALSHAIRILELPLFFNRTRFLLRFSTAARSSSTHMCMCASSAVVARPQLPSAVIPPNPPPLASRAASDAMMARSAVMTSGGEKDHFDKI